MDSTHAAIHERLLASGVQQLRGEFNEDPAPIGFFCLSAVPVATSDSAPEVPELLERIEALLARGGHELLFRERELYHITDLVNRYTKDHVRFVIGLSLLIRVFEYRYSKLPGSMLVCLQFISLFRAIASKISSRVWLTPLKFFQYWRCP